MIKQVNSTTESQPEVTKHTNKQKTKNQETLDNISFER